MTATSRPLESPSTEPTEAEIEAAIVRAMLEGRGAVAEALTATLRARRAPSGNVVELATAKRRGR
jgi:hypothetical protein